MTNDVIDCDKFSSWRRLLRVTAWILRLVWNGKARRNITDENGEKFPVRQGPLSASEIHEAKLVWLKKAQNDIQERHASGHFKTLSPFTDKDGLIRVGGRIDGAILTYDNQHPVLLSYRNKLSTLIARDYHERGHSGVAATMAKIRQKYWILKAHDLVKSVKFKCVVCRKLATHTESQLMANLPRERIAIDSPPFLYTSCDYFGPFNVKFSRNSTSKMYGIIFTCLSTRAVHLEVATDYSTMAFLQAFRRFISIRGMPCEIVSDNGTQFVGAERELRDMVRGWDEEALKDFCAEKGMRWRFSTPAAPHQNGCSEALIKGCKSALKKSIGEQVLTQFELYTALLEVANLMNQRPIGRVPNDPNDGAYLCPNDILLGRSSGAVPQGPFRQTKNPRHRFELVQQIVDSFWKRWMRDYFPSLMLRKKWSTERRNVRVDDIVMMADSNAVRGKWTVGRITQVFPGNDNLVRNVVVKTTSGEYSRPVTKISLIYPAEGFDD